MFKLLLAAALSLAIAGCNPPTPVGRGISPALYEQESIPSPWFIDHAVIPRIECFGLGFSAVGSGVVVDDNRVFTATHVVRSMIEGRATCRVGGMEVDHILDHGGDFSEVVVKGRFPIRAIISCEPIREGERFYATGYALGQRQAVTQLVIGTRTRNYMGLRFMRGAYTPGMSGGGLSDDLARMRGIVNAYALKGVTHAFSVSFSDTSICNGEDNHA